MHTIAAGMDLELGVRAVFFPLYESRPILFFYLANHITSQNVLPHERKKKNTSVESPLMNITYARLFWNGFPYASCQSFLLYFPARWGWGKSELGLPVPECVDAPSLSFVRQEYCAMP
jgi:hypothetical protein